jgi:membrane protein YdbS with pleckstrin-like domain
MRNIKKITFSITFAVILLFSLQAQTDSVSIDTIDNYQGWGWEALVVKNNFITLGIVPSIGARVLQYDLATDTFMITNSSLYGQSFVPETGNYSGPYSGNWGYGGYKTWPAP